MTVEKRDKIRMNGKRAELLEVDEKTIKDIKDDSTNEPRMQISPINGVAIAVVASLFCSICLVLGYIFSMIGK